MPSEEEIRLSQESLYDSEALRDDLNDTEATILLGWGEEQIARIAREYPDEFEQKSRFLRQVIKGINRFVGQREFNELEGQKEYLSKVTLYFQHLGWGHISEEMLFAAIPADKKDMLGTLRAILGLLTPTEGHQAPGLNLPVPAATPPGANPSTAPTSPGVQTESTQTEQALLENPPQTGINQADNEQNEDLA